MENLECMKSLIVNVEGVGKCRWERPARGRSNLECESEIIGMTRRERERADEEESE